MILSLLLGLNIETNRTRDRKNSQLSSPALGMLSLATVPVLVQTGRLKKSFLPASLEGTGLIPTSVILIPTALSCLMGNCLILGWSVL